MQSTLLKVLGKTKVIFGLTFGLATVSVITPASANEMEPYASVIAAEHIKMFETLRLHSYDDQDPSRDYRQGDRVQGTLTIGYGCTRPEYVQRIRISETEALSCLLKDLKVAEEIVRKEIDLELNPNRTAALISFTFNLGQRNLHNIAESINSGDLDTVGPRMELYVKARQADGQYIALEGLKRRRAAERRLFEKPFTRDRVTHGVVKMSMDGVTFATLTDIPGGTATAMHVVANAKLDGFTLRAPDLAVTEGLEWNPEVLQLGDFVVMEGFPPSGETVQRTAGHVAAYDPTRGYLIKIDKAFIVGGYSGSAIMDANGVVRAIVYGAAVQTNISTGQIEYWVAAWAPTLPL